MTHRMTVLLRVPLTGKGPGYTCGSLARIMARQDLAVTIVTPRARRFPVSPADVIEVLPSWSRYVPYRWVRSLAENRIETTFLAFAKSAGSQTWAAHIFADATIETILELKRENITVFREMIGVHRRTMKTIFDEAYDRVGLVPAHGITDASVVVEQEALEAVDYIFCPSPMVEASLGDNGVQASKQLKSSYGWDPDRLSGSKRLLGSSEGITAAFVGRISIEKGAHLLLKYWAQSGVKGRLLLAGELHSVIEEKFPDLLNRNDVVVLPYQNDIGPVFRSADIFVFPSLAEGDPLVTYEACGCGLPVITTPMGAGRIVRDNKEGFVIDPYDDARWISAIRTLAENVECRLTMGSAALKRANDFVWDIVANQRRQQILDIFELH